MKKIYLTVMIISLLLIIIILGMNISKDKNVTEIKKDNIEVNKQEESEYSDLEIVKQFSSYNYDAALTYYKVSEENINLKHIVTNYTYKNNIEKYNTSLNEIYEYYNFTNKKKYIKSLNEGNIETFKEENISYNSYHSMILEVLNNSKYNGSNTITLKTPKKIVKNFLDKFNKRTDSSIKYNKNEKYKLYIKVSNNQITEFILVVDSEKHISFAFTNINQIPDIELPEVEKTAE